jgi:hypothetical protein
MPNKSAPIEDSGPFCRPSPATSPARKICRSDPGENYLFSSARIASRMLGGIPVIHDAFHGRQILLTDPSLGHLVRNDQHFWLNGSRMDQG